MNRYKLYRTNRSSAYLGNCEVCRKFCSEVYHLIEEKEYIRADSQKKSWTRFKCLDLYGHEECLKKVAIEKKGYYSDLTDVTRDEVRQISFFDNEVREDEAISKTV